MNVTANTTDTPRAARSSRTGISDQVRHAALVVAGFSLVFCWVFAQPLLAGTYLAETDLYDYYLPAFLSPRAVWSTYEFAGTPSFADSELSAYYPVHLFFSRVIGSWTGFILSAYVLAGSFAYAYVYVHTRSVIAATVSGTAYALSEALVERMAHPTIVHTLAWLPLVLLSLDLVARDRHRWLWAGIGACAVANSVLPGHPQVPVYMLYVCGAYSLAIGVFERGRTRFALAVAVMALAGAAIAAVSLLPLAEVSASITRQSVAFREFVDYSNTPAQTLSLVFPTISHIGREAPTYVGLATLMFVPLGIRQFSHNWRVGFWLLVVAAALTLGAGDSTPLARLVYALPVQDTFRIVARHLVFAALGLAVLAGFGTAAVVQGRVRPRAAAVSIVAVLLGVIVTMVVLALWPDHFRFDSDDDTSWLPLWNRGVWIQASLAAGTAAVCGVYCCRPRSRALALAVIVVLAGDLVHALPYGVRASGVDFETVPREATLPSVHARRLAAALEPARQRLLTLGGAHTSDVVPPAFATLWRIPIAGGYSNMLLRPVADLAMMQYTGAVDRRVLSEGDASLDILAVRYVAVKAHAIPAIDPPVLTGDRWRLAERFSTSRQTDRDTDEDAPGETEYVVYENRRALPRTWLARQVVPLSDGALVDTIRLSRFRDDRPFNPAETALVDEGRLDPMVFPEGEREAVVESIVDGTVRVRVSSPGGLLVLSDAYYPGWRARVDDHAWRPVHRVNLGVQGIEVPAGRHMVTFEFQSRTYMLGGFMSLLGVIAVAALVAVSWRRSGTAA